MIKNEGSIKQLEELNMKLKSLGKREETEYLCKH